MSWIKQCDQSFNRKASRKAGLAAMGFWGALMGFSGHEQLDGELEREDLDQAFTGGYEADESLWGELIGDEVDGSIDRLEALVRSFDVSDKQAAKLKLHLVALKRGIRRPELDAEKVTQRLIDQVCEVVALIHIRNE